MSSGVSGVASGEVPPIGFGAAPVGNLYRAIADETATALLDAAWAGGLRYFDTAPLYGFGLSETRLGQALATYPRDAYLVSTKVGRVLEPNDGWHPQRDYFLDAAPYEPVFDYSYDGVMRSFEDSLARLKLDRIDFLFMHDIGQLTHGADHDEYFRIAMDGGYRAMAELRASGAVGAIGLGVNEWQVCSDAMAHASWDVFLLAGRYTLLEQDALLFLDRCARDGVSIIAGGVFNSGILATGPLPDAHFDYGAAPAEVASRVSSLQEICATHQTPLGAAALQFPLGHPAVITVIPGIGSQEELNQVLGWATHQIPDALWRDLKTQGLLSAEAPVPAAPIRGLAA